MQKLGEKNWVICRLGAGYVVMSPDIVSASSSTFEKPAVWEWSALLR